MQKFWDGLPGWTKGVVVVLVLIILVSIFFAVKKYMNETPGEKEQKAKDTPAITPQTAKAEIEKLKATKNPLIQPTYSPAQYSVFADQLFTAMNQAFTNNSAIQSVFEKCYRAADVYSIINAYGIRQLKFFGMNDGEPMNLIQALTDEGALSYMQKGLAKNKVYLKI